jgi:hypothetical protein
MRTALLTLVAFSTLAPLHQADACGSYVPEPRIHQLSTHFIPQVERDSRRSFVVLGSASDAKRAWQQLAPRTYDATRIARGAALAHPLTFTIVGKDGTKIVTGRHQVFLSQTFAFREAASAIEVSWSGERAVVIEGSHAGAKWIALDDSAPTTPQLKQWVTQRGLPAVLDSVYVTRANGVELVTAYDTSVDKYVTFLKRGDQELGRRNGRPLGVIELDGARRAVFGDGVWTSSVAI